MEFSEQNFSFLIIKDNCESRITWQACVVIIIKFEPGSSEMYNLACPPGEALDQPAHPLSLNRDFAARAKNDWDLGYPLSIKRRL